MEDHFTDIPSPGRMSQSQVITPGTTHSAQLAEMTTSLRGVAATRGVIADGR